ncbi:MAG: hypothetical protein KME26_02460 [Oscillatoria princeps RMCB-10]|nr:hypothetical protein [Oscillatoria princeps RMCB-10]
MRLRRSKERGAAIVPQEQRVPVGTAVISGAEDGMFEDFKWVAVSVPV